MNLQYTSNIEESTFSVTDFNCASGQQLLKRKGCYKIIWAKDNHVNLMVDGYNLTLRKSQVLFGTPINVIEIPMGQTGILSLVFNREFYCIRDHDHEVSCNGILFFGSSQPCIISLNEKEQESFSMIYHLLIEEFEIRDHIQGEMLRILLKRILIKSTRLVREGIPYPHLADDKIDIIRRFNILVEQHFREKHQVAYYANMLNISPKTLSNLFKKYSEKTARTFLNERIILEAKRLLLFSNKTSAEIAYQLGYIEPGHFSKFFKKQTGFSPILFKKKSLSVTLRKKYNL